MFVVCLFALLLTCVSATKRSCSEADRTLLKYIDWQMTTKCSQKNEPGKCVCKPKEKQPIAFFARLDKNLTNLPTYAVVIFKNVITNEGKDYNPTTGKFTCSEDGVYSFGWTILTATGKRFNTELVVDGTVIAYSHNEATGISNNLAASHSAVVKLKKGNKAWIRTYTYTGKFACAHWSSFTGFRL